MISLKRCGKKNRDCREHTENDPHCQPLMEGLPKLLSLLPNHPIYSIFSIKRYRPQVLKAIAPESCSHKERHCNTNKNQKNGNSCCRRLTLRHWKPPFLLQRGENQQQDRRQDTKHYTRRYPNREFFFTGKEINGFFHTYSNGLRLRVHRYICSFRRTDFVLQKIIRAHGKNLGQSENFIHIRYGSCTFPFGNRLPADIQLLGKFLL